MAFRFILRISRKSASVALNRLLPSLSSLSLEAHGRNHSATRKMSSERMFQLRVDPATGSSEWIVVEESGDEDTPENLLSSTSYLDMLNDSARNRAYYEAIKKTVKKPCHVLDIGAGTGLLSMMAAQAMDNCGGKGTISSCESYLPMGKLMHKVLRINGMNDKVCLFFKRSDELKVGVDLPNQADILISEILDSELLGEGLIPTLQHAHDVLLNKTSQTVPYRATTYGQLVESSYLWKLHDLCGNEAQILDGVKLAPHGLETAICVGQKQHTLHCDPLSTEIRLLSEPFKIFEFDFWRRPESHDKVQLTVNANDSGNIHAVVSWWVLQLDREGTIHYSTAPKWINSGTLNWCDHWKQCIWFTPGTGISVSKDEPVLIDAVHDDVSISYNIRAPGKECNTCNVQVDYSQLQLPPERIAIYADKEWRLAMSAAATNALQGRASPLCVIADDSLFLAVHVTRSSEHSAVISMLPKLRQRGHMYLQMVAASNGFSIDNVKVLGKSSTSLTMEDTNHKLVDVFMAEPFYSWKEGMLPWQQLQFWKERTKLDPMISRNATIMPYKAILRCRAMSLPDLWRSRHALERVEGFNHSPVNEILGACGGSPDHHEIPFLSYSIWQCGETTELSEAFTIMEFNLSDPMSMSFGKSKVVFSETGICHGFALWIDWVMDQKGEIVISTGPEKRFWKQGVKLLNRAVSVTTNGECKLNGYTFTEVECTFNPTNGQLQMKHSFSFY